MINESQQKVTACHLRRDAYLYVRQSTIRQVFENTESTQRQYALSERAVALGWPAERVIVIDSDLGRSGASATEREGFQKLVAEVGLGRAGIVLGLEVSRLARNSTDWHRLLEICALSDTLILDEDGVYDPTGRDLLSHECSHWDGHRDGVCCFRGHDVGVCVRAQRWRAKTDL